MIEIIVATAVFMVMITGIAPLYLGVFDSNLRDADKLAAEMLLQQGLEAVRSIRDYSFSNLTTGTHGLSRGSGYWTFSGSSDVSGKFTRTVLVENITRDSACNVTSGAGTTDNNAKRVTVTINWDYKQGAAGSLSTVEYMTNWSYQAGCEQSSNFVINLSGIALSSDDERVIGVTLENIGNAPISIAKIKISWTNSALLEEVKIGSDIVWKYNNTGSPRGKQPSGTELNIQDFTLPAHSGVIQLDHFLYNSDMSNVTFTIYFIMADDSVRYESVTINDD